MCYCFVYGWLYNYECCANAHMPVQFFALQVLQASGIPGNFSFATMLTSPYVNYTGNYTCELQETSGDTMKSTMQSLTVYGEHNLMIINYDL